MLDEINYEILTTRYNEQRNEASIRDPRYVRWIQNTLNNVLNAGLNVDGVYGRQTRQAVRHFQRLRGLKADGIVGPRTHAALRAAGAGSAPSSTGLVTQVATLSDLASFSRQYIRRLIASGRRIDCADLAIELWIRFGERYGIPLSFRIWDANNRRWLIVKRSGVYARSTRTQLRRFRSTADFVHYVQRNLGARGLIANTYPVPGGHRRAVAGDVFLWEYVNNRTRNKHRWGHTQIIDRVVPGHGGPTSDQIRIAQGSLPPIVPVFRTHPASYFYRPRPAMLTTQRGQEPHTGLLVGNSPRRFIDFRNLR